MKQYVGKLNKTEDELKEAQQLLENKGLKERADLQKERDDLQERLQDLERKMEVSGVVMILYQKYRG